MTKVGMPTTSTSHGFISAPSHGGWIVRVLPISGTLLSMSMTEPTEASSCGRTPLASSMNSSRVQALISSSSAASPGQPW